MTVHTPDGLITTSSAISHTLLATLVIHITLLVPFYQSLNVNIVMAV